ncbi:hypothetical protein U27_05375 [Candidatus Vecturithrix granuli]|uniref:Uncharacterized protein n=1 Tax=Vecturithrix granuli TaxID=1499967 RepID=A0A081C1E6_VECG1|nr:hypothetical protein U27_05375 [Candidatus Vecturithrix granuli]
MTTLAQIEQAVMTLTQDDFQKLYQWMRERDQQQWDQQIKDDSYNGTLDWLADQAISEYRQGRTRPL